MFVVVFCFQVRGDGRNALTFLKDPKVLEKKMCMYMDGMESRSLATPFWNIVTGSLASVVFQDVLDGVRGHRYGHYCNYYVYRKWPFIYQNIIACSVTPIPYPNLLFYKASGVQYLIDGEVKHHP